ncbi:MAG: hypothetical protein C0518_05425 [Opitutus sp.]|nr:hypothetical protein [Opitutus sp.]
MVAIINTTAPAPTAQKDDFASLVNLLDRLTHAQNQLDKLQQVLDAQHLETVRGHMPAYKELQTTIGECESAVAVIAARNPQWFDDKKTVATPYGAVKRTSATSLQVADEAVTLTLIKAAGRQTDFIKVTESLSLETLEKLEDEQLAKFGIKRVTEHNFKAAPAGVDLGKAVKAAEKSEKAAAKAAKKSAGGKERAS